METLTQKPERLYILDTLRGIAIIAMVLHHFLYDISFIFYDSNASDGLIAFFKFCRKLTLSDIMTEVLQPIFQCLFVLISGIACRYSRSNFKRGIKACVLASFLTLLTVIILPAIDKNLFYGCEIYFGILHMLGVSMLLWELCGKLFDHLCRNKFLNIAIPVTLSVVFVVFYIISSGFYDIKGLFWLGVPSFDFYSADYFPILPWTALFFIGAWLGKFVKENRFPSRFYSVKPNPVSFIGRHTLLIYLIHQPLIFGICYLIFEILI